MRKTTLMQLMPLTIYMQILTIYKHMCIPSLMETQHIMSDLQRDQKMKLTIRVKKKNGKQILDQMKPTMKLKMILLRSPVIKMLSKSILFKWSVNEKCVIFLTDVHFFKDGNGK